MAGEHWMVRFPFWWNFESTFSLVLNTKWADSELKIKEF
jgi:hypothetical protein